MCEKCKRKDQLNSGSYFESKTEKVALHVAVEKENIEIVKLLLTRNDFDVNIRWKSLDHCGTNDQKTALAIAVEKDNYDIVKLLLSCEGIDVNCKLTSYKKPIEYYETPLHIAVINENIEIVKLLLSCKNIDPNIYWQSFSLFPSNYGEDKTTLYWAIKKGNLEIVKILCFHPSIYKKIPFRSSYDSGECTVPRKRILLDEITPLKLAENLQN